MNDLIFATEVHGLDLTRQVGFIVTIYAKGGLRLKATQPFATPAEAFKQTVANVAMAAKRLRRSGGRASP